MGFLIDTGILDVLEVGCKGLPQTMQAMDTRWRLNLHVSAKIWEEFEHDRQASALKRAMSGDVPPLTVHPLPLTPASTAAMRRLRPPTGGDKNAGEDESLALLTVVKQDLTWVSLDFRAVNRALLELGSARLIAPHEMFLTLAELELLTKPELVAIYDAITRKCQRVQLPTRLQDRFDAL